MIPGLVNGDEKKKEEKQRKKNQSKRLRSHNYLYAGRHNYPGILLFPFPLNQHDFSPIYEEMYSITSDLNNEIGKIDNVIYESLYKRGVPEKNIFFLAVKPKYEGANPIQIQQ